MISVRNTAPADAPAILRLSAAEPLFSREDRQVVHELLDDYFVDDDDPAEYTFLTARLDGRVVGFACYGPTPLTRGTYDLYWICVNRRIRRKGVGRALMQGVVRRLRRAGARLLKLDTSGRKDFAQTRAFYEREGFLPSARVPGFYARGDDLVIYYRGLAPARARSGSGRRPSRRKPQG